MKMSEESLWNDEILLNYSLLKSWRKRGRKELNANF